MTLVIISLVVATLLEIGIDLLHGFWSYRKFFVPAIVIGLAFASGGLVAYRQNVATGLILIIGAYRLFNVLRITEDRINEHFLRRASRQTSLWLIGSQLVIFGVWWLSEHAIRHASYWIGILAAAQLIAAIILAASTVRQFKKTLPIKPKEIYADRDLPSLTVAIPARNEDDQLEACLQSVIASDYPKLEVIVLDDCSQDHTPEIIRKFAHDGVRFVPGGVPKANWLAKNQAYAQLAKEASGDIILFCGVDVRFAPDTIRQMVTLFKSKKKRMLSLLPINDRPRLSFAQSIRYYWELALPRRLFNRPPVMSTCWLVDVDLLQDNGGFSAVSNSITPEAYFAHCAIKEDAYTFMRSTRQLGVLSVKSTSEQRATAVRVRYPQVHRRPEMVLMVAIAELVLLFAPYLLMIIGFFGVFAIWYEVVFILTSIILSVTYRSIMFATSPERSWYAAPLLPFTILVDVGLLNYSMSKYEFSTVEWKGRNVCIPVMQTTLKLPNVM